jgi:hypothetical protein
MQNPAPARFASSKDCATARRSKSLDRFVDLMKIIEGNAFRGQVRVWDPRSYRLRHLLAVLLVAALVAAALRHLLHVYGGLPREEIRWEALAGALIVLVATLLFRKYRR